MLVKSMLVLSNVKMIGEMKFAQIMVMSIVTVHSLFQLVKVLGLVLIAKSTLKNLLLSMIITVMVLLTQKI